MDLQFLEPKNSRLSNMDGTSCQNLDEIDLRGYSLNSVCASQSNHQSFGGVVALSVGALMAPYSGHLVKNILVDEDQKKRCEFGFLDRYT